MKLARHAPQPPASAPSKLERAASDATDVSGYQLALAPRTRKSAATRALCRKTCSKVESWLERLFISDSKASGALSSDDSAKKRRKQLTRRASTGSLLGRSAADPPTVERNSTPSHLKRASSLFSLHSADKENAHSNASDPSGAKSAPRKKRGDTKDWLTPVASFPETLERDEPMPLSPVAVESHRRAAVVPAPVLSQELQLFTYVAPPVEMPSTYRIQDRHGGMIVAGRAVLFTNAAFKRRLRNLRQLHVIPEHEPAALLDARLDVYLYGLQHVGTSCGSAATYDAEPLSQWI